MRWLTALVAVVAVSVWIDPAFPMPVRPDVLGKLLLEGRIDEAVEKLQAPGMQLGRVSAAAPRDSVHILVLLVDFSDVHADTMIYSRSWYEHMLFDLENPYSMRNFYRLNSYGGLDITGEVYGWFRVKEQLAYYADNRKGMGFYPRNTQRLVEDAIGASDRYVDFSRFDNDGTDRIPASGDDDGKVDYLLVVHAGRGYEWTGDLHDIHSHAGSIRGKIADGVTVVDYATEPEDGRVGTFAHELGHLFGLPDLYDVTLGSFGLGAFSLMAYGSWGGGDGSRPVGLDAWSKTKMGFVQPVVIDSNVTSYRLPSIEDGPYALRVWNNGTAGPQYFMVENRQAKSYDSWLSQFGQGLLVYHVDERIADNSGSGKHLVSLEEADGRFDLEERRYFGFGSDAGDFFPGSTGNRLFGWWTTPDNYSNEGTPTQVSLLNIGDPGDVMALDIEVTSPVVLYDNHVVDDSRGDGDGEPDPGEEIVLELRMKNHGVTCTGVNVEMATQDPFVSIGQSTAHLDSLQGYSLSPFVGFPMRIAEGIPEPHSIEFEISVRGVFASATYEFTDRFTVAVPLRSLAGWPDSTGGTIFSAPVLADLDADTTKEIILGCDDGKVYAWDYDGTLLPGWPAATENRVTSTAAVCDVDMDGRDEVIIGSQDGKIYVFRYNGEPLAGWPKATQSSIVSSPALGDIDDDGLAEIISGSGDGKVYAWNGDGNLVPGWPVEVGGFDVMMSPGIADFDGDHVPEVVVGGYGGKLYVVRGDGTVLDGWPVLFGWGCGRGSPAIADFDGDGAVEIAVSGLFSNSIYVVGSDGKVRPGWPRWAYNCEALSSPVPADLDSDGLPEVAVATSCGTLVAWESDGQLCNAIVAKADQPINYCEPVFMDIDGNGTIDGVVGTSLNASVYAFGTQGTLNGFPIHVEGDVWATPAVGDMDGDGHAEIVVATTAGKIYVWRFTGGKAAGRVEWPQSRGNLWNTGEYGFIPHRNIPLADLAVNSSAISFKPERPKQGEDVLVSIDVKNMGHADAEDFRITIYCDGVLDSLAIASWRVSEVRAKRDSLFTFSWRVPGGKPTRLVIAKVDADEEIVETSRLNNMASQRFYLSVADLAVAIKDVEPFPVVIGDSLTVEATVTNLGSDIAPPFSVAFYDSLASPERTFATFECDSLRPGETREIGARHRIAKFWSDSIRVWCVADTEHRVLEYYMSNNVAHFDISSGIAGEVVGVPYRVNVTDLACSRSGLVMGLSTCACVLVVSADSLFEFLYQSMGGQVDISRNTVVFSSEGDIAGFDIKARTPFLVSVAQEDETQPAVWGENIVWVSEASDSVSLKLKRGSGGVETIRAVKGGTIRSPDISDALVVWEENRGQGSDIMSYDLGTGEVLGVCADEGDQVNPSVWRKTVVWEDHSQDAGDVFCLDTERASRLAVARREGAQQYPTISGDLVVWQDSRNGNWDIFAYILTDGQELPISRQRNHQTHPVATDSTVFWIDERYAESRVMGLRYGGDRPVAVARSLRALSQDGLIRVVANIKEIEDAVSYRLYCYGDARPMPEDRENNMRDHFELGGDSLHVFADTLVAVKRTYYYTLGIVDGYGDETFVGPVGAQAYRPAPARVVAGRPFPNPFFQNVQLTFGLPRRHAQSPDESWSDPAQETTPVEVAVYSVSGQRLCTLKRDDLAPGFYQFSWDGKNERQVAVSPGVYFLAISAGDTFSSRKLILLK